MLAAGDAHCENDADWHDRVARIHEVRDAPQEVVGSECEQDRCDGGAHAPHAEPPQREERAHGGQEEAEQVEEVDHQHPIAGEQREEAHDQVPEVVAFQWEVVQLLADRRAEPVGVLVPTVLDDVPRDHAVEVRVTEVRERIAQAAFPQPVHEDQRDQRRGKHDRQVPQRDQGRKHPAIDDCAFISSDVRVGVGLGEGRFGHGAFNVCKSRSRMLTSEPQINGR